jgi:hypothetical protein
MGIGSKLSIAALAAAFGAMIVPAFAQKEPDGTQSAPKQGMNMGHMDQEMMHGGMMSRGMTGDGCSEMMQSMNNGGDSRPSSQWQKHPNNGG